MNPPSVLSDRRRSRLVLWLVVLLPFVIRMVGFSAVVVVMYAFGGVFVVGAWIVVGLWAVSMWRWARSTRTVLRRWRE